MSLWAYYLQASSADKKEEVGFYYGPPPEDAWTSFKNFIYDPSEGKIFGRTGPSWGKMNSNNVCFEKTTTKTE